MVLDSSISRLLINVRNQFEGGKVDKQLLRRLYQTYNPIKQIDLFLRNAINLFPRLNCGLTTVYIRHLLGKGEIVNGYYGENRHTFLLLDNNTIADITADQYLGPKVYFGPLRAPWRMPQNQRLKNQLLSN